MLSLCKRISKEKLFRKKDESETQNFPWCETVAVGVFAKNFRIKECAPDSNTLHKYFCSGSEHGDVCRRLGK